VRRRAATRQAASVDMSVRVGTVELPAPVMTAAGTAGYGSELSAFMDLSKIGAVVVKSLSADPWAGNPAPRVHETPAGMLNSVGLQGPGVAHWRQHELPELIATGARVVVSIWGRSVAEYALAAEALQKCPQQVLAVEVNLSCPNLDGGTHLFAHDPKATAEVLRAVHGVGLPLWAKLSPNTDRLVQVAAAAQEAGAEAVTLVNTVLGMIIDTESRKPLLGGGGGGLSGPAIRPVAVRAIHDVHLALPDLPIVGVGGCASAVDAVELMLAGASAVQVGTANFVRPSSVEQVQNDLRHWCVSHGVCRVSDLTGGVKH
jgi:dihydroorotate dehydrogenase (NAD+) catalytic subunit